VDLLVLYVDLYNQAHSRLQWHNLVITDQPFCSLKGEEFL